MGKDLHLHIEQQNADGSYKHVVLHMPNRWTAMDDFIDGTDKHSLAWELTNGLPDDISPETEADYGDGAEEDYIDLRPVLRNLMIDPKRFLKPVKRVEVSYA